MSFVLELMFRNGEEMAIFTRCVNFYYLYIVEF